MRSEAESSPPRGLLEALALARLDRPSMAVEAARRGIVATEKRLDADPDDGEAQMWLALARALSGDREQAIARATSWDPEFDWGQRWMARIEPDGTLVLRHTIIAGYPPEERQAGFVAEASRMPIHSALSASPPFHSSRRLTLSSSVTEH